MRKTGTVARGIRLPMIKPNDDLVSIVVDSVIEASKSEGYEIKDHDIIGVTEAIVAKSQNNFASINDIASDVKSKFSSSEIGVVFPIFSRNRFLNILKGISLGASKVHLLLAYPQDEVGNPICDVEAFYNSEHAEDLKFFSENEFRETFGELKHPFTGVDYVELYKSVSPNIDVYFSNNPKDILKLTKHVIAADIHTRQLTKKRLIAGGAKEVITLDELLNQANDHTGYNEKYGVLGSNISTKDILKLFPRDCTDLVTTIQTKIFEQTGKHVEVMVYGDGAFKDPACGIWELADPVVSPGYTKGLVGTPNEIKLKYVLDDQLKDLSKEEASAAMVEIIKQKKEVINTLSEGTTPRRYTDLIGSLCDLMSGSGDKGTPVIHIQGYFDDFSIN